MSRDDQGMTFADWACLVAIAYIERIIEFPVTMDAFYVELPPLSAQALMILCKSQASEREYSSWWK